MTFDPDKNLTLTYNHLNKPTLATFNGTSPLRTIEWVYDASGNKLKKVVKSGSTIQYTQHYIQGIEYRQGASGASVIEAIYHPEGRVFYTPATASRYEYSIQDHLGNTRITFSDLNANNKVDVTNTASNEVLQENHYYPFGLGTNGAWMNSVTSLDNLYQYNGKELNNDWGLGMYEYGARNYDPAVCRFTGVDPIADQFAWVTTYNYAENEPIANIDLWGLQQYYAADGRLLGQIGQNTQARLVSNESNVETVAKYVQWANTARNETDQAYNTGVCDERSCDTGMSGEELNTRAILSTIRETEGHGTPLEYDAQYGNNSIKSFDDHPREKVTKWGYTSTAAGAYQFLETTWDAHAAELGLKDFSPSNQDKAAIREMESVKDVAGLISEGKYSDALKKLSGKWTSLPGGMHEWKRGNANETFIKHRACELSGNSIIATPQGELKK